MHFSEYDITVLKWTLSIWIVREKHTKLQIVFK